MCWAKQLPAVATFVVGEIWNVASPIGSSMKGTTFETDRRQKQ